MAAVACASHLAGPPANLTVNQVTRFVTAALEWSGVESERFGLLYNLISLSSLHLAAKFIVAVVG